MIRQKLANLILRVAGWKVVVTQPNIDKCILCVAPHTSNWDFVMGKLCYTAVGRDSSFLIKNTWFFFPFDIFFKWIGGVPVDRSKRSNLTDKMAELFASKDKFQLAITPEGTRKRNPNWKKGFYQIAVKANVPIMLLYLDYGKKEAGITGLFYPTGNEDADIKEIKRFYKDVQACIPENFTVGNID